MFFVQGGLDDPCSNDDVESGFSGFCEEDIFTSSKKSQDLSDLISSFDDQIDVTK